MTAWPGHRTRRSFAGLATAIVLLAPAACQGQSEPADATGDITLSPARTLPADLGALGSGQAWELPPGRSVAGSGPRPVGQYLVMPVEQEKSSEIQTWVLDTETGITRRHQPVSDGWQASAAIGAGDWMLRREMQEVSTSDCAEIYDCYNWRLYVQRLDSSTPRLLAESAQPGSQTSSPFLVSDGRQIAWQQGDASGAFTIHLWEPGARKATVVAERDQNGLLDFTDDGRLFVLEPAPGAEVTDTVYPKALTQIPLPGQTASPVTTFVGLMSFGVIGQTVAYFPEPGDGHGNWATIPLGSSATTEARGEPIKPGIDGPYTARWISESALLSYSATGTTVYDLDDPAATVTSASTELTAPRVSQGSLAIGYSPIESDGPSMVFTKRYE